MWSAEVERYRRGVPIAQGSVTSERRVAIGVANSGIKTEILQRQEACITT
jgi:hypothetical protein